MKELTNFNFLNAYKVFNAADLTEATQIANDALWLYAKENNSLVPFELIDDLDYIEHFYACASELKFNEDTEEWETSDDDDDIIIVTNELRLPFVAKGDEERRGIAISLGTMLQVIALGCKRKKEEGEEDENDNN